MHYGLICDAVQATRRADKSRNLGLPRKKEDEVVDMGRFDLAKEQSRQLMTWNVPLY